MSASLVIPPQRAAAYVGSLVCPACGGARLEPGADRVECSGCGRQYPVAAGIPVMVEDAVPWRAPLLEPPAARAVLSGLGLAADPVTVLRLRRASGARVRLPAGRDGFMANDRRILRRLLPPAAPSWDGEGVAAVQWCAEYLPRVMRPGQEVVASVRLCNAGTAPMLGVGEGRMTIAYAWSDGDEQPVFVEDARTPLLADLAPGAAVTLPVRVRAPRRAGRYGVRLQMVQEDVRWLEPTFGPFQVTVRTAVPAPPRAAAAEADGPSMLAGWLTGCRAPRVLEIGNGAAPVAAGLVDGLFNVDDDLLALQFGRLTARPEAVPVFAGLDALPFPQRFFDAAVFFGSLHGMADPARVLRQVSPHLRPGGFIGVFGEPCGQPASSPGVLAALRRGENPQQFSLAEWCAIFARAGLRAEKLFTGETTLSARLVLDAQDA